MKEVNKFLAEKFGISEKVLNFIETAENEVNAMFSALDEIAEYNQYKVLNAFQKK